MKTYKYKFLLLIILSFGLVFQSYSKDDKPGKPSNFQVIPQAGNYALFKWKVTQGLNQTQGFKIYYHEGYADEDSSFDQLVIIMKDDTLLKFNQGYFNIYEYVKKQGECSFFITAFGENGESEHSNIVTAAIGENQIHIDFISQPDTTGFVGETYKYTVKAVASIDGLLKYELKDGPAEMDINSSNGVLTWEPKEIGIYNVTVKASLINNSNMFNLQFWTINVKSCKKSSLISGYVKYTNGEFVTSGLVKIFKQIEVPPNDPVPYNTVQIFNGNYSIDLDEGIYLLHFEGDSIIPEWYEDSYTLNEAKRIHVKCGDKIGINATVDKNIPRVSYNVNGKVTRSSDGLPIQYTKVIFVGKDKLSNEIKEFGAITGMDGNYERRLDNNFTYIVFTTGSTNSQSGSDYITQYYNKVDNPSEATIIDLDRGLSGIDFVLNSKPVLQNKISGIVKDNAGNGISGVNVIAIMVKHDTSDSLRYASRSTQTDINGNFKFEKLLSGEYIIMVFADNIRKIPGYYVQDSYVIRSWLDATRIGVSDHSISENIIIKVPDLLTGETGRGVIQGVVTSQEILLEKSIILSGDVPVSGAIVYVIDINDNIKNYSVTDYLGRFNIKGMKAGNYRIFADKVGFLSYEDNVVLIDDSTKVIEDFQLEPLPTRVNDGNTNNAKVEYYPNPAINYINLSVSGINGILKISLFNSLGISIISDNYNADLNGSNYKINLSELSSGFYYIKIDSGSYSEVLPIVISR